VSGAPALDQLVGCCLPAPAATHLHNKTSHASGCRAAGEPGCHPLLGGLVLTAGVRCRLAHQLRRRQPGCCWLCLLGCCAGVLPALPAQDCLVRTASVRAAIACLLAMGWRRLLLQHLVAVTGVPCLPLVKYSGGSVDPSSSPACAAPGHMCPVGVPA
jgi:hypothetical protein